MSQLNRSLLAKVGSRFVALFAILAMLLYPGVGVFAASGGPNGDGIGKPTFTTDRSAGNFSATARTIPYFRSSFTDPSNGVTYPYTMVGTDPAAGAVSTTIPTVIIPMNFTFVKSSDPNNVLNGTDRVAATVASPMFLSADIGAAANASASAPPADVAPVNARPVQEPSDVTQVGDAIYRAQWGVTGTGYHVLLGQPTVLPAVTFSVPANQGQLVIGGQSGARIGLVSYSWFTSHLNQTLNSYKIDPGVLPIFLVNNTFLYYQSLGNCCILGYHGASTSLNGNGKQQVNTYMFASYSDPGIFSPNDGDTFSYIADIHGLSHEVQEWMDDPFVNNVINPWLTPTAPQYGCTNALETGDPVVGYGFEIPMSNGITYHPEDEVHYSWFAREAPSRAAQGYFTYLNNFAGVAQGCQ